MKKLIKNMIALILLTALIFCASGCGAGKYLLGKWKDESGNVQMKFGLDGQCMCTMFNFPMRGTYVYENDTLTVTYSDELSDSGIVTFYGDNEFVWDKVDKDGNPYQEYYIRDTSKE